MRIRPAVPARGDPSGISWRTSVPDTRRDSDGWWTVTGRLRHTHPASSAPGPEPHGSARVPVAEPERGQDSEWARRSRAPEPAAVSPNRRPGPMTRTAVCRRPWAPAPVVTGARTRITVSNRSLRAAGPGGSGPPAGRVAPPARGPRGIDGLGSRPLDPGRAEHGVTDSDVRACSQGPVRAGLGRGAAAGGPGRGAAARTVKRRQGGAAGPGSDRAASRSDFRVRVRGHSDGPS
jgi:hypothetical protein